MDSRRRYSIRICFCHPWGTRVFRNYKGLSIIFPKIYDAVLRFTKVINFLIPRHRIFESDNFRFPFCTKNSLTWGLKRKKLILDLAKKGPHQDLT